MNGQLIMQIDEKSLQALMKLYNDSHTTIQK